MGNWIRLIYPNELNKGFSSKFCVGSWVWHETPEEGRSMHQLKCEYTNKDEDISLNILTDKKIYCMLLKFYHLLKKIQK